VEELVFVSLVKFCVSPSVHNKLESEMFIQRGFLANFPTANRLKISLGYRQKGNIVTRLKLALFLNPCKGRKTIHLIIKAMQIKLLADNPFL
jgi:hypothetical protein